MTRRSSAPSDRSMTSFRGGVLHHTGDVWTAIDNAASLVRPEGRLWIALYTRTYASPRSLRTKRLYNRVTPTPTEVLARGVRRSQVRPGRLPAASSTRLAVTTRSAAWTGGATSRIGLGGLPYEPVGPGEVLCSPSAARIPLDRLEDALGRGRERRLPVQACPCRWMTGAWEIPSFPMTWTGRARKSQDSGTTWRRTMGSRFFSEKHSHDLVDRLLKAARPSSVVDIGCGNRSPRCGVHTTRHRDDRRRQLAGCA